MTDENNLVKLYGSAWSECGYCHGERAFLTSASRDASSKAYTVLASMLSPHVYEKFLYRGWRRSGCCIYKPDNWLSCCPLMTIRLPVDKFQPTKSQRRVLRRMEAVLNPAPASSLAKEQTNNQQVWLQEQQSNLKDTLEQLAECTNRALVELLGNDMDRPLASFKLVFPKKKGHTNPSRVTAISSICAAIAGPSSGKIDRTVLSSQLAAILREKLFTQNQDGKRARLDDGEGGTVLSIDHHAISGQILVQIKMSIGRPFKTPKSSSSSLSASTPAPEREKNPLAGWLGENGLAATSQKRQLTMDHLPALESALDPTVHKLYAKYQHAVHNDPDPFTAPIPDVQLADASSGGWSDWGASAPESWLAKLRPILQSTYQHLPTCRQNHILRHFGQFYEFLVEHPFQEQPQLRVGKGNVLVGTYHQHYRVDGVLIMVGVVDVLPSGLSSVYLIYDPSFAPSMAALGKFAILREIEWARGQAGLPYYYLGYYVHSNSKMRYKADYSPSQLLCPTTYFWVDAALAIKLIEEKSPEHHCCTLCPDREDEDAPNDNLITELKLQAGLDHCIYFNDLAEAGRNYIAPHLKEFVKETGRDLSLSCTLDFRST